MELKEFFKFSWRKVIITIILLVIGSFSTTFIRGVNYSGGIIPSKIFNIPIYIFILPFLILSFSGVPNTVLLTSIGLIVEIIYLYTLSCLVDLIIRKVKSE